MEKPMIATKVANPRSGLRSAAAGFLVACLLLPLPRAMAETCVAGLPQLYGDLFEDAQQVLTDTKGFVDATPKQPPAGIAAEYENLRGTPGFDLRAFIAKQFVMPPLAGGDYRTDPNHDVREHIDALWSVLERKPEPADSRTTLLPLPYRYIVPGGRFNEIYYWDSYFTMLGLEESGRHDLAVDMVKNFAWLIDHYGHIPNGNRTYFLSRSQPPFFAAMVNLLAERDGPSVLATYLPQLAKEHEFWMQGGEGLAPGQAHRRVVRLADGSLLNRYWDDCDTPREESYGRDVETTRASGRPAAEVYRNLRAGAESGWDYSSRWLADGKTLATVRTVEIVPPDLNSLLYNLELTLAKAYRTAKQPAKATEFQKRAEARKAAIRRHLWNTEKGMFADYLWKEDKPTDHVTAATLYPLFFGIADRRQADQVAKRVRADLLQPNGLATTMLRTGEQWDMPNGWAPLQWIAIQGLNDYGHKELAETIAERWIRSNVTVFEKTGKLVEKYDVTGHAAAGGGEYELQDGFGWTNGVLRKLIALYPAAAGSGKSQTDKAERAAGQP
ncbi:MULTISPECIES: alpha,alpha-trehalase TreF [unclassified Pseudoxanthomonas]|uniref:alpha,alpha-trehalase TreF n=1 Tax=unclassified Pseudoxanthomonas TaxID=2645906 RepID=UPI003077853F